MPLYEYYCTKCQKPFEASLSVGEHEHATPACPSCQSPENVEHRVSPAYVRTARKS